jgi:hypothetical protein
MSEANEAGTGKPRRRTAAKTGTRQTAGKVKATIHLSVEASQRLTVHAAMLGLDRSALMEKLIQEHLRRFVVSDRGGAENASQAGSDSEAA